MSAAGLTHTLSALEATARARWPSLGLPADTLRQRVFALHGAAVSEAQLQGLFAADLYLAAGCLLGNAQALQAFETEVLPQVRLAIARLDPQRRLGDEVQQTLRERLLVGAPPKLAAYSGRGPLAGWVCAAAVRESISLLRDEQRSAQLEEDLLLVQLGPGPELEAMRAEHQQTFLDAFRSAFRSLESDQRTLLRLQVLDGLNLDQLAALHQVHRSTASRWLTAARDTLRSRVHLELRERLKLSPESLNSLLRLFDEGLELSIGRVLREPSQDA
ncbi:MAG: hypothetical protein K1X89_32090 [Myxococcaceae bacterium]|nr:hypothetical protein [Myxococcaceae bacterium]